MSSDIRSDKTNKIDQRIQFLFIRPTLELQYNILWTSTKTMSSHLLLRVRKGNKKNWKRNYLIILDQSATPYCNVILQKSVDTFKNETLRQKRLFQFPIVNFSIICSNIPSTPAYGVFISQLIQYSTACGSYHGVRDRGLLLTKNLLNQGFLLDELKSPLLKVLWSPPWPGEGLLNICVTTDHGYVQLVVLRIRSFPNLSLITGFTTK